MSINAGAGATSPVKCPPPQDSSRHPKPYLFFSFFNPLFCEPVLVTRATKKEYSGARGSQNESNMEPKTDLKVTQKGSLLENTKN